MDYRREIDGLRALAVLPVILFHAGFEAFKGGFIGVDVFFVISGYLITSIILEDKKAGDFSLIDFYERRARRILPALFFVTAVCILFAWLWLLPSDMKNFSQSLISMAIFSSNILFWLKSGYFDTDAVMNPLLHTWSLAVEEQYYVLFPIFIILMWRCGNRLLIGALITSAIASLWLAHWGAYNIPSATFFLLPTRGWELTMGALIAFYLSRSNRAQIHNATSQILSVSGLLLILYAVFTFSDNTPFPSIYALVPTVGTSLIILTATPLTSVGKLLGSKAFVSIGLVSYSAYLWHQPLFSFARQRNLTEPSAIQFLLMTFLTLILAYLSWRFIESPFRNRKALNKKQVFVFAVVGTIALILFGVAGVLSDGFISRFTKEENQLLQSVHIDNIRKEMAVFQRGICFADYHQSYEVLINNKCISQPTEAPKVILFGDSHASHLLSGVRDVFGDAGYKTEQWTAASCRAIHLTTSSKRCQDFYTYFVSKIVPQVRREDVIIVSSNWYGLYDASTGEEIASAFRELSESLSRSGATILLIGDSPAFAKSPQEYMVRAGIQDVQEQSLLSLDNIEVNMMLKKESDLHNWRFFNPAVALCDKSHMQLCLVKYDDQFLYFDDSHLNEFGSLYLMKKYREINPSII